MFINKLQPKFDANAPTMSDFIGTFLRTEVTCIPGILKKVLGNYYNNSLCNAATWVFLLWCFLHYAFDRFLDAVFRKLKFKQYVRQRLKSSLWYLGFYSVALIYLSATITRDEVELFNFKRMTVPSQATLPIPAFIGYTLISTFYLHSSVWEALTSGSKNAAICYVFLSLICIFASIVKITETVFAFTAVISLGYVAVEVTKILYSFSGMERFIPKIFIWSVFVVTFVLSLILHLVVIPLTFLIPLSVKLFTDFPSISLIIIYISLVAWSAAYLHRSVVYKLMEHWLYHTQQTNNKFEEISTCPGKMLECVLFPPRNDFSYNIYIARKEAKIRQAKILAKRTPAKDRLNQTLRCVLTIKRKLEHKRKATEINTQTSTTEDSEEVPQLEKKELLEEEDGEEIKDVIDLESESSQDVKENSEKPDDKCDNKESKDEVKGEEDEDNIVKQNIKIKINSEPVKTKTEEPNAEKATTASTTPLQDKEKVQ